MASLFYLFLNDPFAINQEKIFVLLQIVIITILLPLLFIFLLKTMGKVSSYSVPEVSQRKIPLLIQLFLIILLVKNSIPFDRYPELHFFFLGAMSSTMIALILSFFKNKASLHMLGISALTLFVIGLSLHYQINAVYWIAFLILSNGFVAASRLEMKAHTTRELFIGFLIGSIPQLLLIEFWL
jgi:hypothetical protein